MSAPEAAESGRGGRADDRRARRVSAHVALVDAEGRAVLPFDEAPGDERLPGGRVGFGEDPAEVARSAAGLPADAPLSPRDVRAEFAVADAAPAGDAAAEASAGGVVDLHIDRLYYTAPLAWADSAPTGRSVPVRAALALPARPPAADLAADEPARPGPTLRRFSCYGVVTDPAGRILLSHIAPGFPGAGTWHPPGGGVDHGETPHAALRREIREETDQECGVGELIAITHYRRTREVGPESAETDVYAIWTFFHAHVAEPRPLRVVEVGGSTDDCAWFDPDDLTRIPLSATARRMFTDLSAPGPHAD